MKNQPKVFALSVMLVAVLILAACGAASAPTQFVSESDGNMAAGAPMVAVAPGVESSDNAKAADGGAVAEVAPAPAATMAPLMVNAAGEPVQNPASGSRMIIKNGDIKLLVKDTEVALDRTTQIVGDLGGYIVSSRAWYQEYYGTNFKYVSLTIGVPSDQFENALRRLRGLAIRVLDETASGEDVTDQFVDLQSQLTNLQATRDRIRGFLNDAKTVEEALRINDQLTQVEKQIEEIQGRMNYLSDRASYSTITISIEPELPPVTPTPTYTPTSTSTPRPTYTPTPWQPGKTFTAASDTVVEVYKWMIEMLIWIVVVVVPIFLPIVLIGWLALRFFFPPKRSGPQKPTDTGKTE